jgi:hypothetical protein
VTEQPPKEFTDLSYWTVGLEVARRWYHEEWEGSHLQHCLARDIAQAIDREVEIALENIP